LRTAEKVNALEYQWYIIGSNTCIYMVYHSYNTLKAIKKFPVSSVTDFKQTVKKKLGNRSTRKYTTKL
jgi:hypothetical protein